VTSDTAIDKLLQRLDELEKRVRDLETRPVEEPLAVLRSIVDAYDARSELFTNDADCAANLADRARKGIEHHQRKPFDTRKRQMGEDWRELSDHE